MDAETQSEEVGPQWTEENNARRVELINKTFDRGLTAIEKNELEVLSIEADQLRDQASAVRTGILKLILAGLKQQEFKRNTG